MIPQANQIYKHFKGNLYRIITVAVHTETEEELVVYQALYGDFKVYARPLSMFMGEVDHQKYPEVTQKMRFELVEQMVDFVAAPMQNSSSCAVNNVDVNVEEKKETVSDVQPDNEAVEEISAVEEQEEVFIDPLLEAYLDTDSYREKLNVLHGLQHRITEHMLNTMAIVIDFELPEGDIQTKYNALNDCLLTKEKYECSRMI